MRKYIDGSSINSTTATLAHLAATAAPIIYTLVVIKLARWYANPYDGTLSYFTNPILLTDCPAAIVYGPLGTFRTAAVAHGAMSFQVGIDYNGFDVTWSPGPNDLILPASVATASVPVPPLSIIQGVLHGIFDGAYISVYKCVMPTFYDAATYGAMLVHTGTVDQINVDGGQITFTVGSIIDQQDQQVPSQIIGPSSRFASLDPTAYAGSTLRYGTTMGAVTLIDERVGTTSGILKSQNWPTGYVLPVTGFFDGGFVVWTQGPLLGMRRGIAHSVSDPSVGSNGTIWFYLSQSFPYDANLYSAGYTVGFAFDAYSTRDPQQADPLYNGFPYVPNPVDGV